jgi:hypothetical protein
MAKRALNRHIKTCKGKKRLLISKIDISNITDSIKDTVAKTVEYSVSKVEDSVSEVKELIKNRPPVLNVYIGDNVYDDLVKKMGKKDAVDFLIRAASDNDPLSVIDKLYLDDIDKEDWPIAYRNGEFKYISEKKEMIIDRTGNRIGKLFGKVHNAMIQAVSEMINNNLNGTAEDINGMYDTYNMLRIQRNLYKICGKTDIFCNRLRNKVTNPVHPFFQKYFIKLFFDDSNMMKSKLAFS